MLKRHDKGSITYVRSGDGITETYSDPRRIQERSDFEMMPDGQSSTANLSPKMMARAVRYQPTLRYMKE